MRVMQKSPPDAGSMKLQMRRFVLLLGLVMFAPLLTACSVGARLDRVVVSSDTSRELRRVCGSPTMWTKEQAQVVGRYMLQHEKDAGMQLLAPEWQRLHEQVKTCRGER